MKNKFKATKLFTSIVMIPALSCIYASSWAEVPNNFKADTEMLSSISQHVISRATLSDVELSRGVVVAKERHAVMLDIIKKKPSDLLSYLLPKSVVDALPRQIQKYMEKEVKNLKGVLRMKVTDYPQQNKAVTQYFLVQNDGAIYNLNFTGSVPAEIKVGDEIRLQHAFLIESDVNPEIILMAKDIVIEKASKENYRSDAFGAQQTIFMLVNFQDNPSNKPITPEQATAMVFGNTSGGYSINNSYVEQSYNQTTVVGRTIGWYTLPMNTACDTRQIESLADQAATAAGVDLSPYTRRVYFFPYTSICGGWAGQGSVGRWKPNYSVSWINGWYNSATLGVTAHEMGHNMGLLHSHSLECSGASNTGTCSAVEYGDKADTMGGAYAGEHFNALQKEILGWLNYNVSPPIQTVTTSGSYTIFPYELNNTNVKGLKIPRIAGSNNYYYLEYRQPIGFDATLNCSGCDFVKGILVHQGDASDINSSYSLDMSPTDTNKKTLVALMPGNSFVDPAAPNGGVTIRVDSVTATQANVTVSYGSQPPVCTRNAATISMTPANVDLPSGASSTYTVKLQNNDSAGCGPSTFSYAPVAQSPLVVTMAQNSHVVSPGQIATLPVAVSAPASTVNGVYNLTVTAKNATSNTTVGTMTSTATVKNPNCVRGISMMEMSPSNINMYPGSTAWYGAKFNNTDSVLCGPSTFAITASAPSSFTTKVAQSSVSVNPGQTVSVTVTARANITTAKGVYTISAQVKNATTDTVMGTMSTRATVRGL